MLRIGFKTDEYNLRSQKALEKIGARFEGLQRKHMVRPTAVTAIPAFSASQMMIGRWRGKRF